MRTISLVQLLAVGACTQQTSLFLRLFGEVTPVTGELCKKHAEDFDFRFAAQHFLSDAGYAAFLATTKPTQDEWDLVAASSESAFLAEVTAASGKRNLEEALATTDYEAEYTSLKALGASTLPALQKYRNRKNDARAAYQAVRNAAIVKRDPAEAHAREKTLEAYALTFCQLYNAEASV